jgi:DNA (cytosine-5)-methyltransferase 1
MKKPKFKFIDLFAGIGGFHMAMHRIGGECVFASENDIHARTTYEHNFRKISPDLFKNGLFNDDIRSIVPEDIPNFDILCAGFPCQPFSQAGHKRGFHDTHKSERGNLFFNITDILEAKKPKAFFLENVRGIVNHDNGNTFKVIREILEEELGYSFYYEVIYASYYGLPQLRPRTFMIGFRDEGVLKGFYFPPKVPLKFNMSDVWGGECSREIGFTLRVGGRGSNIKDKRNWDSYLVDGEVKKIMPKQAKKMQGFPNNFKFPVANTQAMKQLGNSVAVDAIQICAKAMVTHMLSLQKKGGDMFETKNKGEWTEFLSFIKILNDRKINLSDKELKTTGDFFNVTKVTTKNIDYDCFLNEGNITVSRKSGEGINVVELTQIIDQDFIEVITQKIKEGSGTFKIAEFSLIENKLGFTMIKGGTSNQKADIILDINKDNISKKNEGFGIKSYLGSRPTLLNASGNTNFIYKVEGMCKSKLDEVNAIDTRTKLKDRINKIYDLGGQLHFDRVEKDSMDYNLKLVDSFMPEMIGYMLYEFYINRTSSIKKNITAIHDKGTLNKKINYGDINTLIIKVKKMLVDVLLGFFPGKKWDGKYESNGTIVVKESGEQVGFHVIDICSLQDYLFNNIKFDTPSTTRHRYGSVILEKNKELYFKLNLQLRF